MSLKVLLFEVGAACERDVENVRSIAVRGNWLVLTFDDGSREYLPSGQVSYVTTAGEVIT